MTKVLLKEEKTEPVFTKADVGCYGDSSRGRYLVDRVVELAEDFAGFDPFPDSADDADPRDTPGGSLADYEHSDELWDDAEEHLNAVTEDGLYWGNNDNGDFGLWTIEDEETTIVGWATGRGVDR